MAAGDLRPESDVPRLRPAEQPAAPPSRAARAWADLRFRLPGSFREWLHQWPWLLLLALLLANLVAAATFDRGTWPGLIGDEATYAMQAQSLAWDFDLTYEAADYQRFLDAFGREPEGLILQSRDGGEHLVYSKPFPYALYLAPFVRVAPVRGPAVANALLLALAAVVVARVLVRRVGSAGPLWVAAFVFASVAFGYTFWIHPEVLLMASTALGFALIHGRRQALTTALPDVYEGDAFAPEGFRESLRWLAAGVLVALPVAFRPFYLPLLLPALVAVPSFRRGRHRALLLAGALAVLAVGAAGQWLGGGSWSSYGGERQGFYDRTGFPDVDFPRDQWQRSIERWGNTSWIHEDMLEQTFDLTLLGWDGLYFFVGQNVGVLPYFLPILLPLLVGGMRRNQWAAVLAIAVAALCFFYFRPFNFYGGGGAIANRYFLPLYPLLWFPPARRQGRLAPVIIALAAAPFLLPLWLAPRAWHVAPDGSYHHVSALAKRWLPWETSLSHLARKHEDVVHNALWLRFANDAVWPEAGGGSLRLMGGEAGRLLVGSPTPLAAVTARFGERSTPRLEVQGAEAGELTLAPGGAVAYELLLEGPRAVHPMWWSKDPFYLYELVLELPEAPPRPIELSLTPVAATAGEG